MNIVDRIDARLLNESQKKCKQFWCIPYPSDDGFSWEIESMDADEDDLSNWLIVLHKLKHLWKKDFDSCKESYSALPRGIIYDGSMLHGNNTPIDIMDIAGNLGMSIGDKVVPKFSKTYAIKLDDMNMLQDILGQDLGLQYTES